MRFVKQVDPPRSVVIEKEPAWIRVITKGGGRVELVHPKVIDNAILGRVPIRNKADFVPGDSLTVSINEIDEIWVRKLDPLITGLSLGGGAIAFYLLVQWANSTGI